LRALAELLAPHELLALFHFGYPKNFYFFEK
jgi:hypothetical protein